MVKKDFIQRGDLNAYIIAEYRRGRTVKSISRDITHYTTDEAGGGVLSKGYAEQVIYDYVMRGGAFCRDCGNGKDEKQWK